MSRVRRLPVHVNTMFSIRYKCILFTCQVAIEQTQKLHVNIYNVSKNEKGILYMYNVFMMH